MGAKELSESNEPNHENVSDNESDSDDSNNIAINIVKSSFTVIYNLIKDLETDIPISKQYIKEQFDVNLLYLQSYNLLCKQYLEKKMYHALASTLMNMQSEIGFNMLVLSKEGLNADVYKKIMDITIVIESIHIDLDE